MGVTANDNEPKHIERAGLSESNDIPPDHPLNWSSTRKHLLLLQCAINAMMAGFTSAVIIPGIPVFAEQFDISANQASYLASVHVLFLGLGPFLWHPFLAAFGKRPILIFAMLLACVASIGGAVCKSYSTLMTARVFQAIGISNGFAIGNGVVLDIFWSSERGAKLGLWAQMVTIGAPLGGLIGGPLINVKGWPWALWLSAIITGAEFVAYIFTFDETSYAARQVDGKDHKFTASLVHRVPSSRLGPQAFLAPLLFFQSPAAVLCAFAYGISFGLASVGTAVIIPQVFGGSYDFGVAQTGLVYIAALVGVLIGEQAAGPVSDVIMKRHVKACKMANTPVRPEYRLWAAVPGYILVPAGLIIFGVTLQFKTHWIGPCIGLAVASCGLQAITTVLMTYCVDSYSSHPLIVGQFVNVTRQTIAFTVPFWSPLLNEKVGYGLGFGVEAIIAVAFYILTIAVFWKGESLRRAFRVRGLDIPTPRPS